MFRIVIDPGHGGDDRGAVVGNIQEANLNLKLSLQLKIELEQRNISPILTRADDIGLSLSKRCEIERLAGADCFISIHHNCFPKPGARGWEIFYYSQNGLTLASCIADEMNLITNLPSRGIKADTMSQHSGGLYVLRNTKSPAVLIEAGFISNPQDAIFCNSFQGRKMIAEQIADGVEKWLKLKT